MEAFRQFKSQSGEVVEKGEKADELKLAGEVRRYDAGLAMVAIEKMMQELNKEVQKTKIIEVMNEFPGAG